MTFLMGAMKEKKMGDERQCQGDLLPMGGEEIGAGFGAVT